MMASTELSIIAARRLCEMEAFECLSRLLFTPYASMASTKQRKIPPTTVNSGPKS